jgi:hypothetical protein
MLGFSKVSTQTSKESSTELELANLGYGQLKFLVLFLSQKGVPCSQSIILK